MDQRDHGYFINFHVPGLELLRLLPEISLVILDELDVPVDQRDRGQLLVVDGCAVESFHEGGFKAPL